MESFWVFFLFLCFHGVTKISQVHVAIIRNALTDTDKTQLQL